MSQLHLPLPFLLLLATLFVGAVDTPSLAQAPQNGIRSLDWTRLPARYTHANQGLRVDQFAKGIEPLSNERPDFVRSGYRHYRSTLQAGTSADNFHVVEEWGNPVRPYDEWRFPFRPYSAPYPMWGPQPVPFGGFSGFGGFLPNPDPFNNQPGFNAPANFQAFAPANGPAFPPPFRNNPNIPNPNNPNIPNPNNPNIPNPNNPNTPYNPWQYANPAWNTPPWANGMWPNIDEIPQPRDEDFFRRPQSGSN